MSLIRQVTVIATDMGTPRLSSSVLLNLTVLDRNDHAPLLLTSTTPVIMPESNSSPLLPSGRFNSANVFMVRENLPPDTYLGDLVATDGDTGLNGQFTFELTDGLINQQYFALFRLLSNGSLYTSKMLDREEQVTKI